MEGAPDLGDVVCLGPTAPDSASTFEVKTTRAYPRIEVDAASIPECRVQAGGVHLTETPAATSLRPELSGTGGVAQAAGHPPLAARDPAKSSRTTAARWRATPFCEPSSSRPGLCRCEWSKPSRERSRSERSKHGIHRALGLLKLVRDILDRQQSLFVIILKLSRG